MAGAIRLADLASRGQRSPVFLTARGPAGAQQFAQAKTVQHAPRGSPPLRALSTPNGAIELRGGMGIRLMHTKHPNSLARACQCKSSQGARGGVDFHRDTMLGTRG